MVADWSAAASHLHANQLLVTQLLCCVDTGTFTVRRGNFHLTAYHHQSRDHSTQQRRFPIRPE